MFDCSGTSGDFICLFHFSEIFLDLFFKRQEVLLYNIPYFFWIHLVITVNQKMSHCYDDFQFASGWASLKSRLSIYDASPMISMFSKRMCDPANT